MGEDTERSGYLDAIFAAVRAFARELASSREWVTRVEHTKSQTWRLSFLHEARAAHGRAGSKLATAADKLGAFGPLEKVPPPLDRLGMNLGKMRAELAANETRLAELETKAVRAAQPIGQG